MGEYISPRMHVVSAIPSYYHLEKKNEMQFQSQNLIFVDVVTFFFYLLFFIDCNCTKNKSRRRRQFHL